MRRGAQLQHRAPRHLRRPLLRRPLFGSVFSSRVPRSRSLLVVACVLAFRAYCFVSLVRYRQCYSIQLLVSLPVNERRFIQPCSRISLMRGNQVVRQGWRLAVRLRSIQDMRSRS